MRFSIRWLLAGVAYVALVTAAVAAGSSVLVDVVWGVTLVAVCYAVVVACVGRGRRQAIAIGFVIMAMLHILGMYLLPSRVPAMRLISAIGYSVFDGEAYEPDPASPGAYRAVPGLRTATRTANAVATLAVGLVGCLVGGLAYRNHGEPGS
jgi:hypothetical protein